MWYTLSFEVRLWMENKHKNRDRSTFCYWFLFKYIICVKIYLNPVLNYEIQISLRYFPRDCDRWTKGVDESKRLIASAHEYERCLDGRKKITELNDATQIVICLWPHLQLPSVPYTCGINWLTNICLSWSIIFKTSPFTI